MGYATAVANRIIMERAYRIYITDAVRAIGMGQYPSIRWADSFTDEEERSADEIVSDVVERMGLEVRR